MQQSYIAVLHLHLWWFYSQGLSSSLQRSLRFHLGTIAFGSLIIAILRMVSILLCFIIFSAKIIKRQNEIHWSYDGMVRIHRSGLMPHAGIWWIFWIKKCPCTIFFRTPCTTTNFMVYCPFTIVIFSGASSAGKAWGKACQISPGPKIYQIHPHGDMFLSRTISW